MLGKFSVFFALQLLVHRPVGGGLESIMQNWWLGRGGGGSLFDSSIRLRPIGSVLTEEIGEEFEDLLGLIEEDVMAGVRNLNEAARA